MELFNVYPLVNITPVRALGAKLWDDQGQEYLDFYGGHAVISIGHSHPHYVQRLTEQLQNIGFYSNSVQIPIQTQLAHKLGQVSGYEDYALFLCNSGAEANECAIKLARLYGHQRGIANPQIIVMERAWHGRTLATLAASGSRKAQAGFEPLVTGFIRVPYNDIAAIRSIAAHNGDVVAVLAEVLQGEGGIYEARADYLRELRQLCTDKQWFMMIDEVQSGIGRTGKWFAHQWADIVPDVMPLAKGLGSGLPIGACVAKGVAANVFKPGNHGTTFGAGPLVSVAALTTLAIMEDENLLDNAAKMGALIKAEFATALSGLASVKEIRGMGLMLGIELDRPCADVVKIALEQGVFINVTHDNVIRLLPPLTINEAEARELVARVSAAIKVFLANSLATSLATPVNHPPIQKFAAAAE